MVGSESWKSSELANRPTPPPPRSWKALDPPTAEMVPEGELIAVKEVGVE
jgi:hypothetical protein